MKPGLEPDLLQAILDNPQISIISTGPDGKVRTFNRGAEALLGYKAEEMIGKVTPEVFHDPEETRLRSAELKQQFGVSVAPGFETFVSGAAITGAPDVHQWTYIRKDGQRIQVVLAVSILRDRNGGMAGYIGIAMPVPGVPAISVK